MRPIGAICALISFLFLGSCVSTIPSKASSKQCLIVIKVKVKTDYSSQLARNYIMNFSGHYPDQPIPNENGFVAFTINESDISLATVTSKVDSNFAAAGAQGVFNCHIKLPYIPGRMIIMDLAFSRQHTRDGAGFRDRISFVQMDDEEKNDFRKSLISAMKEKGWDAENAQIYEGTVL